MEAKPTCKVFRFDLAANFQEEELISRVNASQMSDMAYKLSLERLSCPITKESHAKSDKENPGISALTEHGCSTSTVFCTIFFTRARGKAGFIWERLKLKNEEDESWRKRAVFENNDKKIEGKSKEKPIKQTIESRSHRSNTLCELAVQFTRSAENKLYYLCNDQ